MTVQARYDLDEYLSPLRLPAMAQETFRVLSSAPPDDQRTALTVFGQNLHRRCTDAPHVARRGGRPTAHQGVMPLAASGHATVESNRWAHGGAAPGRFHLTDGAIREVLDRLVATIRTVTCSDNRARGITARWNLPTDPTRPEARQASIVMAVYRMM